MVEYTDLSVVRAGVSGFVDDVRVESGQQVHQGDVLAVLVNDELSVEQRRIRLEIEQSGIRGRVHYQQHELPKFQVEVETGRSLQKKLAELQQQVDSLVVRAGASGRFVRPDARALVGQYVSAGDALGVIGREEAKELLIALPHDDVDLPKLVVGAPADVLVNGCGETFHSHLAQLDPRAGVELPHPALFGPCRRPD